MQIDVTTETKSRVRGRVAGMNIHFFLLHGSLQPFNVHIMTPGAFAVHADADAMFLVQSGEYLGCKLKAVIRVHYLRCSAEDSGLI